ncbi:MAG: hypothetical protein MRECE_40c005 [Mycoplasmataceae bacterium CE_OT135]|nr:MAG: hypothetical protein MRECE_40c005 [Mycoplasmataceae bacterium CE_OT135]
MNYTQICNDCKIKPKIEEYQKVLAKIEEKNESWRANAIAFWQGKIKELESKLKGKCECQVVECPGSGPSSDFSAETEGDSCNFTTKECEHCGEYILTLSSVKYDYSDTKPHECQSNQINLSGVIRNLTYLGF